MPRHNTTLRKVFHETTPSLRSGISKPPHRATHHLKRLSGSSCDGAVQEISRAGTHKRLQYDMEDMYQKGLGLGGVEGRDILAALYWYRKSAALGYVSVQHAIGTLYKFGLGIDKDPRKAFEWFLKAAELEYGRVQYRVGNMYN
ncbi:hypothetical protein BGX24_004718 [Mortierella sp. AD032]|nr:hypothetical protein BGX24_004718 [Mortierella sp. AD032]